MIDIGKIATKIADGYAASEETVFERHVLPNKKEVSRILKELQKLLYPAYFAPTEAKGEADNFTRPLIGTIYFSLKKQIVAALHSRNEQDAEQMAEEITDRFFEELPNVQRTLATDAQATFDGDPAAKGKEEIIISYPGFYAIFVYRLAHVLYESGVPFIPRMMTEYAHGKTGIDINPGAKIGEYFFIDHGTGVVIGETTVIGRGVKLYQGVTLGALSPRKGQSLAGKKRHPTVEDNVTVYAGASILGGETVIGEGAVIGGNAFILSSVEKGARVSAKLPELIIK